MCRSEPNKSLLDVLADGLKASGFDGLFTPGICGCLVDDLSPGNCLSESCKPGYKHTHSVTGDWIVSASRATQPDDEITETIEQCG